MRDDNHQLRRSAFAFCLCAFVVFLAAINTARTGSLIQPVNEVKATPPSSAKTAHLRPRASTFSAASRKSLSLASENFRISYPAQIERREIESVLQTLEAARADLSRRLASASLATVNPLPLEIVIHASTGDFVALTGQPPWAAAVTHDSRIELQPLDVLRRRNVLITTLRHEYTHALIEALGHGRAPRWLAEGLAAHVAVEGARLSPYESKTKLPLDEIERRLALPSSAQEMRALYAAAYSEVRALIRSQGETRLWQRVAQS